MRILLPLDGSEFSLAALPVAVHLARATGGELVMIAVGELPESSADAALIRTDLQERIRRASAMAPGIPISALMELGDRPAEAIVQAARSGGIDHIVMATHGRTALAQILMGSCAAEVVRDAPVPVTLVRPRFAGDARDGAREGGAERSGDEPVAGG